MEISFSGSGWLMYYQLGVAVAIQEAGLASQCVRFTGASAGAVAALLLAIDFPIKSLRSYFIDEVMDDFHANPVKNTFKVKNYVEKCLRSPEVLECLEKAVSSGVLKQGRFAGTVTTLPDMKSHLEYSFDTAEEAIQAALASCALFPIGGTPFKYAKPNSEELDKKWIYDGGLLNMMPKSEDYSLDIDKVGKSVNRNLSVSAFWAYEADVKPTLKVPIWWCLLPAQKDKMRQLFELGIKDFLIYASDSLLISEEAAELHRKSLISMTCEQDLSATEDVPLVIDSSATKQSPSKVGLKSGIFKTLAATSGLVEKGSYIGFLATKILVSELEKNRRAYKPQGNALGFFSARLWVPDSVLSLTQEQREQDYSTLLGKLGELGGIISSENKMKRLWYESNVDDFDTFKSFITNLDSYKTFYPL